jgi:phage terminase large subunit GpA-like protein
VQPTVELAKRNSRQRIDPPIEEPGAPGEGEARARDAGNTMLSKEFAGGILIMTGANSAVGLRSTPARYIFLDEVDAYPASADEEAIRRRLPRRGRSPSRLGARCSSPRRRRSAAFPASSASMRPRTSGASSLPARTAE